jgi:hypothetical protein
MRNIERFRKVRHYTVEIDPTTAATVLLSSTTIGNVSGQALGANFEITIHASSDSIHIGFSSTITTTNSYEIDIDDEIHMMVEDKIWGIVSNTASGKFKAIVWD